MPVRNEVPTVKKSAMTNQHQFDDLIRELSRSEKTGFELRSYAMKLLDELETYDWSGIYILDGETLTLDAYVGSATDHTKIQVGVGVCGTAVAEDKNQIIEDVRNVENYLSCATSTRLRNRRPNPRRQRKGAGPN